MLELKQGLITLGEKVDVENVVVCDYLEILESIKTGIFVINGRKYNIKNSVDNIRLLFDSSVKYDKEKRGLPYACWAGTFEEKRTKNSWKTSSQIVYLDLDFKSKNKSSVTLGSQAILQAKKDTDYYFDKIINTYSEFIIGIWKSVSKAGLSLLLKYESNIYTGETYTNAFNVIKERIKKDIGIEVDKACSDITRVNFLSLDPDIFINEKQLEEIESFVFVSDKKRKGKSSAREQFTFDFGNSKETRNFLKTKSDDYKEILESLIHSGSTCRSTNYDIIDNDTVRLVILGIIKELTTEAIELIKETRTDITEERVEWMNCLFNLVQIYEEEEARKYFHEISKFYANYDPTETDNFFNNEKEKEHSCFNSYIIERVSKLGLRSKNNNLYCRVAVAKEIIKESNLQFDENLKGHFKWLRPEFFFDPDILEIVLDNGEKINIRDLVERFEDERLFLVFNYAISREGSERFIAKKTKEDKAIIVEADPETKLWESQIRSTKFLEFVRQNFEELVKLIKNSGVLLEKTTEKAIRNMRIELYEGGEGIRKKLDNLMFDKRNINYDSFNTIQKGFIPIDKILVNMQDDTIRAIQYEDYIQDSLDFTYNPNATCPNFDALLSFMFSEERKDDVGNTVYVENKEVVEFFWKVVGCSLAGHSDIKKFLYLYGPSNTGKSTLFNVLKKIFGKLSYTIPTEVFQQGNSDRQRFVSKLKNKRFCYISELPDNRKLDQAFLKSLTGGDPQSYRELFKEPGEDFIPGCLFFFTSNHHLKMESTDEAFSRRLCPIKVLRPISEFVPPDNDLNMFSITDVVDFFAMEAQGIINRCIEGFKKVINENNGIILDSQVPQYIINNREIFLQESDIVALFFSETYQLGMEKASNLNQYDMQVVFQTHFNNWKKMEGVIEVVGYKHFRRKLRSYASDFIVDKGRKMFLQGVSVRPEYM